MRRVPSPFQLPGITRSSRITGMGSAGRDRLLTLSVPLGFVRGSGRVFQRPPGLVKPHPGQNIPAGSLLLRRDPTGAASQGAR